MRKNALPIFVVALFLLLWRALVWMIGKGLDQIPYVPTYPHADLIDGSAIATVAAMIALAALLRCTRSSLKDVGMALDRKTIGQIAVGFIVGSALLAASLLIRFSSNLDAFDLSHISVSERLGEISSFVWLFCLAAFCEEVV